MGFFDMQAAWVFITVSGEAVDGGAEHMGMQTGLQVCRGGACVCRVCLTHLPTHSPLTHFITHPPTHPPTHIHTIMQ